MLGIPDEDSDDKMDSIAERLHDTARLIRDAYARAQRQDAEGNSQEQHWERAPTCGITCVAVSKTRAPQEMNEYAQAARAEGIQVIFGESYLQEYRQKASHLSDYDEVHLIGPLQSNKVREAVASFDLIHSVHSEKILALIAREAARIGKRQRILLQVNIGEDPRKSGFAVADVERILSLVEGEAASVQLEGLMTITPFYDNPEDARGDFRAMANLRRELLQKGWQGVFQGGEIRLSMGMSGDFAVAIEEGADFVRIGTALFGARDP